VDVLCQADPRADSSGRVFKDDWQWGRPWIYLITALRSAHMWLSIVKQDLESDMCVKVFVPV
jgi:DMSO/TMAO reductase YedYZ heme-binding membrane subunit